VQPDPVFNTILVLALAALLPLFNNTEHSFGFVLVLHRFSFPAKLGQEQRTDKMGWSNGYG
jgi:hypothetical protein